MDHLQHNTKVSYCDRELDTLSKHQKSVWFLVCCGEHREEEEDVAGEVEVLISEGQSWTWNMKVIQRYKTKRVISWQSQITISRIFFSPVCVQPGMRINMKLEQLARGRQGTCGEVHSHYLSPDFSRENGEGRMTLPWNTTNTEHSLITELWKLNTEIWMLNTM